MTPAVTGRSLDAAWRKADRIAREADIAAFEACRDALTPGRVVTWMHGEHERTGTVLYVSGSGHYNMRVKVFGPTGVEQWIYVYRVLQELR